MRSTIRCGKQTVAQFRAYCEENGINFSGFKAPPWGWIDSHPMVNVTWEDAGRFCIWAGGNFPTEAQWERAARGDKDPREYPWGNEFDANRLQCSRSEVGDANSTAPAGSHPSGASPFGCLDMAGNVWQWCMGSEEESYAGQPNRNPTDMGNFGTTRAIRGGSSAGDGR